MIQPVELCMSREKIVNYNYFGAKKHFPKLQMSKKYRLRVKKYDILENILHITQRFWS